MLARYRIVKASAKAIAVFIAMALLFIAARFMRLVRT